MGGGPEGPERGESVKQPAPCGAAADAVRALLPPRVFQTQPLLCGRSTPLTLPDPPLPISSSPTNNNTTNRKQLYSAPDLDLLTSACRFTLPGRCAAFGGKGLLAAAGDDGLVKLCRIAPGTGESKIVRQISTGGFVRSVAVDPEGAYVAATLADGTLGVWDAATGQQEAKRAVGSKVDPESTRRCAVAWSPDGGTLLAVAGRDNDAVLLERLSWCVLFLQKGGAAASCCWPQTVCAAGISSALRTR